MSPSLIEPLRRVPAAGRLAAHWRRPYTLFAGTDGLWAWPPGGGEAPQRHDDLRGWCGAHPGATARLVLSGRLTLQVVADDERVASAEPEALAAWARFQFGQYHGSAAERWPVAAWSDGRRGGASALRGLELADLLADAKAHRVQLTSIEPWWSVALRAVSRERPIFGRQARVALMLVEGASVTWVACEERSVVDLQQRWLDAPDGAAIDALLHALVAGLPAGTTCWGLAYGCRRDGDRPAVEGMAEWLAVSTSQQPERRWVDA